MKMLYAYEKSVTPTRYVSELENDRKGRELLPRGNYELLRGVSGCYAVLFVTR